MPRPLSLLSPAWWDYTTLDPQLLRIAARLDHSELLSLSRPGFRIQFFDTIEEFYLAEALEYIHAWQQARPGRTAGICGPIGPTEHLPLVARIVNDLGLRLEHAHFWGMDEWVVNGRIVADDHPMSFAKSDLDLCFNRIEPRLRMPMENLHFPTGDLASFSRSFDEVRCVLMQGGQGDVKHWAFNDPPRRSGDHVDAPPSPEEYRRLGTRITELHPATVMQNARTSSGGDISAVPTHAVTVGPNETWKAEAVSIWHAGMHDNAFGMRLTTLMISQRIIDTAVPMSLLADHPDVRFNFFRPAIGTCSAQMH